MISKLTGHSCEYVRPSTLAWSSVHSPRCQMIDSRVASAIGELAKRESKSALVVDCRDISRVEDHAFDSVIDEITGQRAASAIQNTNRSLLFWIPEDLDQQLEQALGRAKVTYSHDDDSMLSLYGPYKNKSDAVEELNRAQSLLRNSVTDWIADCFQAWEVPQRLPSTPILANGFFDSRIILSDPERFRWTCVALRDLAYEVLSGNEGGYADEGGDAYSRNVGILAVSLRASAFAAGVSNLLGDNFLSAMSVVDHAGPRKRIFERSMLDEFPDGSDLILLSDFVVGGSELRVAEILAEFRGGRLIGVITLGTALKPAEYSSSCDIKALAHLPSCAKHYRCEFFGS
jgi:hypothetical protein